MTFFSSVLGGLKDASPARHLLLKPTWVCSGLRLTGGSLRTLMAMPVPPWGHCQPPCCVPSSSHNAETIYDKQGGETPTNCNKYTRTIYPHDPKETTLHAPR